MAKDLAALMVFQLFQLGWPLPDCIIPVPISHLRFFQRGYEQNLLLAQEMSLFLQKPVLNILKRDNFFDEVSFKKRAEVSDRILLLVVDEIKTIHEINLCSRLLEEGTPKAIYALSFSGF
jgi:predicted amidophosphoribosyltransferase